MSDKAGDFMTQPIPDSKKLEEYKEKVAKVEKLTVTQEQAQLMVTTLAKIGVVLEEMSKKERMIAFIESKIELQNVKMETQEGRLQRLEDIALDNENAKAQSNLRDDKFQQTVTPFRSGDTGREDYYKPPEKKPAVGFNGILDGMDPALRKLVAILYDGNRQIVKTVRFLKRGEVPGWNDINEELNKRGLKWISAGKESHWE